MVCFCRNIKWRFRWYGNGWGNNFNSLANDIFWGKSTHSAGDQFNKFYTYGREDEKQKILVVCSFSDKVENWKVPSGYDVKTAELCLCNYKEQSDVSLRPCEARVYLWKK